MIRNLGLQIKNNLNSKLGVWFEGRGKFHLYFWKFTYWVIYILYLAGLLSCPHGLETWCNFSTNLDTTLNRVLGLYQVWLSLFCSETTKQVSKLSVKQLVAWTKISIFNQLLWHQRHTHS